MKGFDKKKYMAQWRAENRERVNKQKRAWRKANAARCAVLMRIWWKAHPKKRAEYDGNRRAARLRNPEKHKQVRKVWRDKNRQRINEQKRARFARKREAILANHKRWRSANYDRQRAAERRRELAPGYIQYCREYRNDPVNRARQRRNNHLQVIELRDSYIRSTLRRSGPVTHALVRAKRAHLKVLQLTKRKPV